jgi:hypothetical protein
MFNAFWFSQDEGFPCIYFLDKLTLHIIIYKNSWPERNKRGLGLGLRKEANPHLFRRASETSIIEATCFGGFKPPSSGRLLDVNDKELNCVKLNIV